MVHAVDVATLPSRLAPSYSRFRVAERILLTGHSHQAWPDVAREAVLEAFDDAAAHVDEKWGRAFVKAQRVREGLLARMGDVGGDLALAANTHDLLIRFLSALPLRTRPRVVTTDGEFHTVRRQLARLAEEGLEVVAVPSLPAESVGERLADALDDRTATVIVSRVFFDSGAQAGGLAHLAERARALGIPLVVDSYHAVNAVEFSLQEEGLLDAYVLGGGYKYLQLGEGNCFLRYPRDSELRPVVTGWFADFEGVANLGGAIRYGPHAGQRFAGATYDPTSHYRAAAVLDFFDAEGLTPAVLRQSALRQLERLRDGLRAVARPGGLWTLRDVPLEDHGAFLMVESPQAGALVARLGDAGVLVDHRGDRVRVGPAPYVSDAQLDEAVAVFGRLAGG
jgi:kynureninase